MRLSWWLDYLLQGRLLGLRNTASSELIIVLLELGRLYLYLTVYFDSRYPEKRYTILGTNLIMERMKVGGLSRKANYAARFEALIKDATVMLNKLFLLAAKDYRNYIVDQVTHLLLQ